MSALMKNNRGVALIVVLLVTALLIALVFEFAYGTRISLRAAVNFRDSQRAYFLARSGVNFAGALLSDNLRKGLPQDNLEQREWQIVPIVSAGDTELRVRWEDEGGKISIVTVGNKNSAYLRLTSLFEQRAVSQDLLDRMVEERNINFLLLTQLHQHLGDEDFFKVKDFVTVSNVSKVNINTASSEVLQSLGLSSGMAEMVVERRNNDPFKNMTEATAFLGPENNTIAGQLDVMSHVFKVNSFATVGGYTKQVEAVITRKTDSYNPFTISYWRAL